MSIVVNYEEGQLSTPGAGDSGVNSCPLTDAGNAEYIPGKRLRICSVGGELLEGAVDESDAKKSGNRHTIDLSNLGGSAQRAATVPATYLVDMAKAEALGVMGEAEKAVQLVDRHI